MYWFSIGFKKNLPIFIYDETQLLESLECKEEFSVTENTAFHTCLTGIIDLEAGFPETNSDFLLRQLKLHQNTTINERNLKIIGSITAVFSVFMIVNGFTSARSTERSEFSEQKMKLLTAAIKSIKSENDSLAQFLPSIQDNQQNSYKVSQSLCELALSRPVELKFNSLKYSTSKSNKDAQSQSIHLILEVERQDALKSWINAIQKRQWVNTVSYSLLKMKNKGNQQVSVLIELQ